MNIENHFYNVDAWLKLARKKLENLDYDGALACMTKAYSQTRNLLDEIYQMKMDSVPQPDHPGENES